MSRVCSRHLRHVKPCVFIHRDYPKMSCISNKSHADTSIVHSSPDVNIDARLWLSLRLQIAKHLSECVKIPVIDQPLEAEALIGSAAYHIEQGLKEADGLNDKQALCKFVMLGIMNSVRTGEDIEKVVIRLKVGRSFFQENPLVQELLRT